MSLATMSGASLLDVHAQFTAALPAMETVLRFRLRHLPKRCRAEALADARAACWHAWHGLLKRGKDPLEVGPTGIAINACRYVKAGRQLGCGSRGRGVLDIFSKRAQRLLGFKIVGLDRQIESRSDERPDAWREWLCEDNRHGATPAEIACFRIDFANWLGRIPVRKRQMAELLVEGYETGVVATMLGVTPAAVSQSRVWLETSWRTFMGEAAPPVATSGPRPVGRPRKGDEPVRRRTTSRAVAQPC